MSLTPQFGSLIPSQTQQTLANNYLQFNTGTGNDFAQQYLPEVYEQEVERYGNRTLSGFLRMVGAEMPMTSDQVIWSEQNRLHISYDNVTVVAGGGNSFNTINLPATVDNVISPNDTIVVLDPATGAEAKALVTSSTLGSPGSIIVQPFNNKKLDTEGEGIEVLESIEFKYQSMNRFIVLIETVNKKQIILHLDRFGIKWKLVNVILP